MNEFDVAAGSYLHHAEWVHEPDPGATPEDAGGVCNIGLRLRRMAARLPGKRAVVFPEGRDAAGRVAYTHLTFAQLEARSDAMARGLSAYGIGRGVRTLLMVRPSLDFFALVFALFKAGAVPVLIDPGMGVKRLLHCIREAEPEAMVGIPLAHLMRVLRPSFFRSVRKAVTVGRRWAWGGATLDALLDASEVPFAVPPTREDERAAILFTTGSTGPAKGVEYEHGMFEAQCRLIQQTYGIGEADVDLPTFPLFALFSVGLGMTAVVPDMEPTRPAHVNPARIVEAIRNHGCTFSFGSPALWGRVSAYCVENGVTLPSLRTILMAGAPIPVAVHERLLQHVLAPGADTHTPYGATESLPATSMRGSEVLAETAGDTRAGKGTCVGYPVHGITVEVIGLSEAVIPAWSEELVLPPKQIGEITVKGPSVTKRYYNRPDETAMAKIHDGDTVRHRIGDLGYKDEKGRLWFCGRKNHRVVMAGGVTLYSVCCEAIFNQHPAVARSALVGLGERPAQEPVIVIEPRGPMPKGARVETLAAELLRLGEAHAHTRHIRRVMFHPSFPVDIRHNAKIFREVLKVWAERRSGGVSKG